MPVNSRRHLLAALLVIVSAIIWSWVVVDDPNPWHRDTATILAASLIVIAAFAVAGILIENSRLGYWLAVATIAAEAVIALLHRQSVSWYVGVGFLGFGAFLLSDPALGGWIRRRTSAAPVPAKAVALGIVLLASPGATAVTTLGIQPGRLGVLALVGWATLLIYARRLPGALLVARAGPPLLALGSIWLPPPGRWVWLALMGLATSLAASSEVRLAIRPLIERGSRLMIPPELAPEEIRRALGKDS